MARRKKKKSKVARNRYCFKVVGIAFVALIISALDLWAQTFFLALFCGSLWLLVKFVRRSSQTSPGSQPSQQSAISKASTKRPVSQARKSVRDKLEISNTNSRGVQPLAQQPQRTSTQSKLRWLNQEEAVTVHDIVVHSGLLYIGDNRTDEASAINPRLPIGKSLPSEIEPLPYYPQYDRINPFQRRRYLQWLSSNRTEPLSGTREFGYIFLFFYGLERRLLLDNAKDPILFQAAADLMVRYSDHGFSSSLPTYVSQLLHFAAAKNGLDFYNTYYKWIIGLPHSQTGDDDLAILLAHLLTQQAPLPVDMAFEIASISELSRQSVVIERVSKEFRHLFEFRYKDQFSEGIQLKCGKATKRITYHPANPSLLRLREDRGFLNTFSISVPNVFASRSQFKVLSDIWNSCVNDLSDYSRQKGRNETHEKAFLALPLELRSAKSHPLYEPWLNLIMDTRFDDGCCYLEISQIAEVLNVPARDRLTKRQSEELNHHVESLGFACEPDSRHWGMNYGWRDRIGVFPQVEQINKNSPAYLASAALLQLGYLVANADGHVSDDEVRLLHTLLTEAGHLSTDEQQRLMIQSNLLSQTPDAARRTLSRIASHVSKETAGKVGEFLFQIAAADGVVTKQEHRVLVRVFTALGLDIKLLDRLSNLSADDEEPIVARPTPSATEPIPPRITKPAFSLNMDKIADISAETSALVAILAEVMTEPESEEFSETNLETLEEDPDSNAEEDVSELSSLSPEFHDLLRKIITKSHWEQAEFHELCASENLMPLSVFDALNAWADDILGDFLLEGENPIMVYTDLLPKGAIYADD